MKLSQTVELMNSSDYKDRFKAEYYQLKIRYERLKDFNNKIETARISYSLVEPTHDCPDPLLRDQQHAMGMYLKILEQRAIIEGIELDNPWLQKE